MGSKKEVLAGDLGLVRGEAEQALTEADSLSLLDFAAMMSGEPDEYHTDDGLRIDPRLRHLPRELLELSEDGEWLLPDWQKIFAAAGLSTEEVQVAVLRYVAGLTRKDLVATARSDRERRALEAAWRRVERDRKLRAVGDLLLGKRKPAPAKPEPQSIIRRRRRKPAGPFVSPAEALKRALKKRESGL